MRDKNNIEIAVQDLSIGYDSQVLMEHLNFEVRSGEFFCIKGGSGCGKSTIAAFLSGARTATEGEVTLGGIPVSEWKQADRLRLLTLVPHNAAIFKGTVEANLRMARPDAAEAELWAALEQVNLADFCRSQSGLATALHEGGSNLSGGPRQRLALARRAGLPENVRLIFVTEITQRRKHRIRRGLAETTERTELHGLRRLLQQFKRVPVSTPFDDVVEHREHLLGAFAAGNALAARLRMAEVQKALGQVHRTQSRRACGDTPLHIAVQPVDDSLGMGGRLNIAS